MSLVSCPCVLKIVACVALKFGPDYDRTVLIAVAVVVTLEGVEGEEGRGEGSTLVGPPALSSGCKMLLI